MVPKRYIEFGGSHARDAQVESLSSVLGQLTPEELAAGGSVLPWACAAYARRLARERHDMRDVWP